MIALYVLKQIAPSRVNPERKPWVAKLLGLEPRRGYLREFVEPSNDYVDADKKGRGVKAYFALEAGYVYEVHRWRTRFESDRFFVRVDASGDVVGVHKDDVFRILREAQCARDEKIRQSLDALDRLQANAS